MALLRREFLRNTGLTLAVGFLPFPFTTSEIIGDFFERSNRTSFAIKDAYVLSMDERLGDINKGTIIVDAGEIKEIGQGIIVPEGMDIIDGANHIAMPGLIDCHQHLWTSLLKSMAGDIPEEGYFPLTTQYSRKYTPDTMEIATRYAAAEALNSGITTVSDYNHNAQNPDFVLAGCKALAESGMRAQILYGSYRDKKESDPTPFQEMEEVLQELKSKKAYDLLTLGLGSRGPEYSRLESDWERARELGFRIAIHAAQTPEKQGQIKILSDKNLLDRDVNIIHANYISEEEINLMAKAGNTVTMTPYTEMRIGFGQPKVNRLYNGGVNLTLGVDSTALTGSADLFENMKMIQNLANARAQDEFYMRPYEVLKMATINGARALGIDHLTGSLTPGKRADIIMLNRKDLNLSLGNKPRHLVVEAARGQNVSFVCVDGQVIKLNRELVEIDREEVTAAAKEALLQMTEK